jgi:hypothetical protein
VGKENCNVSFGVEGTATLEAEVTAADCPNSRLRAVALHSLQSSAIQANVNTRGGAEMSSTALLMTGKKMFSLNIITIN